MKDRQVLKAILDKGMRRGTLTYDEINDAVPPEWFSLDEMENLMKLLDKKGIKVVEFDKRRN